MLPWALYSHYLTFIVVIFLRLKEGDQLKTVINHPYFQSDPLGSIFQHLLNTQPAMDEKPKRRDSKTGKKKAKVKKLKTSKSMEI